MSITARLRALCAASLVVVSSITSTAPGMPALAAPQQAASCGLIAHTVQPPQTDSLATMAVAAPGDIWVAGGSADKPQIWRRQGSAWLTAQTPDDIKGRFAAMTATDANHIWAVGQKFASDYTALPFVWFSDGGAWREQSLPVSLGPIDAGQHYLDAIEAISSNDVWTVGASVYHFDGHNWRELSRAELNLPDVASISSLGAVASNDVWLAGSAFTEATASYPVLLHWDGKSWNDVSQQLPPSFWPVSLTVGRFPNDIWSVDKDGKIAHWNGLNWQIVPRPVGPSIGGSIKANNSGVWFVSAPSAEHGSQIFRFASPQWEAIANPASDEADVLGKVNEQSSNDEWLVGTNAVLLDKSNVVSKPLVVHVYDACDLPTTSAPDPHTAGVQYFPEVQHSLRGPFLTYWRQHGGLAQFGYPISEEFLEKSADGETYNVQYFQRNRFEYHPENQPPYDVLLGRLGADAAAPLQQARHGAFNKFANQNYGYGIYFPQTGHNLRNSFLDYWQAYGGLALYGYPISEEFAEKSPTDGKTYIVQYFERNRFEYHPEYSGTTSAVLLSLLGSDALRTRDWLQ